MTDAEAYAVMNEIFQDVFFDDDLRVFPEMSAKDVAGWNSLRHIDIIVSVENRFHVRFTAGELDNLTTVGDLVRVVVKKTLL